MTPSTFGKELYHGSPIRIEGSLKPILRSGAPDYIHTQPAVFATERKDIAAVFMFPTDTLASIGFENDIAYICIWGTSKEFAPNDKGGISLYTSRRKFSKDRQGI